MSESVYKALISANDKNVEETAKFILMIEKFFDALNVTNLNNGQHNIKSFQSPYTSGDDFRLKVCM